MSVKKCDRSTLSIALHEMLYKNRCAEEGSAE